MIKPYHGEPVDIGTAAHPAEYLGAYLHARRYSQFAKSREIMADIRDCFAAICPENGQWTNDVLLGRIDGLSDELILRMPPGTATPSFKV